MDKKSFRKQGLASRRALTAEERSSKSAAIAAALVQTEAFQRAQNIFCYVSAPDEVHTEGILRTVLSSGKALYIPYVTDAKNGLMTAARLYDLTELREGLYGIPTVAASSLQEILPVALDLVLVPGSAFDLKKQRIGMGGGYYDRFLLNTRAYKIALAYECQMFSALPADKYDQSVDWVITESKIY